jgi:acyl-CoA thioester hydrolase
VIKVGGGIAHTWLCDHNGHLNTRHHLALFDDANLLFMSELGYHPDESLRSRRGWADVRNEIDYLSEVKAGGIVEIYAGIAKLGTTSVVIELEMRAARDARVHSRMRAIVVHFDMDTRAAIPLPDEFRRLAEPHLLPAAGG